MGVIEFKKREEIKILFGIKLPSIVTEFYKESKNIFELDYNGKVDIEDIIKRIKK